MTWINETNGNEPMAGAFAANISELDFENPFVIPVGDFAGWTLPFDDPLLPLQSFITGFSADSQGNLVANIHINLLPVWEEYSGQNISIVSRESFDPDHADLPAIEILDLIGFEINGPGSHGTATIGIINAVADNGVGSAGIAYGADVSADGYISATIITDFDIYTNSGGGGIFFLTRNDREAFEGGEGADDPRVYGAEAARDGLGIININSAGNQRYYDGSTQASLLTSTHEIIAVAAATLDFGGSISYYSTPGAGLHITGLLGSLQSNAYLITTDISDEDGYVAGASGALTYFDPLTDYGSGFDSLATVLAPGDYTYFNGTSATAPIVAGVTALVLEASTNNIFGNALGWRDVQEIFAVSARHLGSAIGATELTGFELNPWFINGAAFVNGGGFHVSSDYGFGLVDAHAAVRLAETWGYTRTSANLVQETLSQGDLDATFSYGNPLVYQLQAGVNLELDVVEIALSLSHEFYRETQVTLTSPDGTISILLDTVGLDVTEAQWEYMLEGRDPDDIGGTLEGYQLLSRQFWGEETEGVWTITIEDLVDNGNEGTLTGLDLTFKGDLATDDDTFYFTSDWALMNEANGGIPELTDSVGINAINAAAIMDNVHLSLVAGSSSSFGGEIAFSLSDDAAFTIAIAGDGRDTLTGSQEANQLYGMRGNDRILGGAGDDVLVGGADNDTLRGDAGSDVSYGGAGNDQLWAGGTDDAADTLIGGAGNDIAGGGVGADFMVGGGFSDGAVNDLGLGTADSSAEDGSDTLFGGDGNDTLLGGGWDDGSVNDNGSFDRGEEITSGTSGDALWAGDGDDLVIGAAGADAMGGGGGDDTLMGGGGNDLIYGGRDAGDTGLNDVISGGDGDDVIFAGAGADSIDGGNGADDIYSGGGSDTVDGGAGDDTLWGGGGNDTFTGGSGADTFVFANGHGEDAVTDFDTSEDILFLANTATDFTSADDVAAAATVQNGGLLIDLGGGDSVFLEGILLSDVATMNLVLTAP